MGVNKNSRSIFCGAGCVAVAQFESHWRYCLSAYSAKLAGR